MKILTIIGARPQFIKAAIVSKKMRDRHENIEECLLHTGQHYDENMSQVFFDQMGIVRPAYNLEMGNLSHGAMTGRMLESIEGVIQEVAPDFVMVYGDTNSTLAGALAAAKLHVPVVHVESGLRSYNMAMPEEINRILTDQISTILFCPTDQAVTNLKYEGFEKKDWIQIIKSGDVMYDAAQYFSQFAVPPSFDLPGKFILATLHRAENTDDPYRLKEIIQSFNKINKDTKIILPLHPRARKLISKFNIPIDFFVCDPLGYLQMLYLLKNTSLVMTDSGGLQKEAYFFKKYCVTIRNETEWIELIKGGFNVLAASTQEHIFNAYSLMINKEFPMSANLLYGEGNATNIIVDYLSSI